MIPTRRAISAVDSFPEAPRDGYLDQGEEPGIVREPVRRQPLPDAGSIDGEEQASIAPETGNEIINAEPPAPLEPPIRSSVAARRSLPCRC